VVHFVQNVLLPVTPVAYASVAVSSGATSSKSRPPLGSPGLYHLAWEVPTIEDLAAARATLADLGALIGESDHGATKSLYAQDPDGNEFEVMWLVPRDQWGEYEHSAVIERLDLERELGRYGGR